LVCCTTGCIEPAAFATSLANTLSPVFPLTSELFDPTSSLLLFKRLNVNILIEIGQNDPKNKRLDSRTFQFSGAGPSFHRAAAGLGPGRPGAVSGVDADRSNSNVAGAKVTPSSDVTGVARSPPSPRPPVFAPYAPVVPGSCQVSASQPGIEAVTHSKARRSVDRATPVSIDLRVGALSEVVEGTGSTDLTETSNSTVGWIIDAEVIDRVPLTACDVVQLVQFSRGVAPANGTYNASDTPGIFARALSVPA
jgi:hypothetical protein